MGTLNEDLDNIKAIEDKLTANKVANFAYTDHAYDNPLTEADGVTNYNVNNEQNIPVADPFIMNVNETVLTKGWRSQASAITRMLMNHFLGRVSYNLNKLNDNMSALLTTLRANLSNVVNTGDSANVSSGGTTKFTTGGAYNLLSSIAPYFSTSTSYAVGDLITYQNKLYECTTAHSAGAWNAGHFTARNIQYVINNYILPSLAPAFSASTAYAVGDFVIYQNKLYRCTVAHNGAWNSSDFTLVTVGGELTLKADKTSLALPTDAVLHYSFDDVPDYPDGSANVRLINNNTYDIQSGDYKFNLNPASTTLSNENGNLKIVTNQTGSLQWSVYLDYTYIQNKIIKIKFEITSLGDGVHVQLRNGASDVSNIIGEYTKVGTYEVSFISNNSSNYPNAYIYTNAGTSTIIIKEIYIGDGTYSTPIIDNANGEFNATNNGGIATNGVSGKGAYFLNNKIAYTETGFQFNANFSVSLWVKPDNNTSGLNGNIISKDNQLILRNGASWGNYLMIYLYGKDSTLLDSAQIRGTLLTPNVWTNIIITRSELTCKCYINGTNVKTFPLADNTISQNTNPLYICGNSRPQSIDDLLIFDRALTEAEVKALYLNKANTPKYYGEVPVTRKVNGYTLDKDITLTKADMGLGDVANKDLSNVVNTGDSSTPVSGGTTKFTTGGAYTELNKKVDKTTTVNGHALSGNVTVTKADLSLDNVVNTGDSATPVSGGTTKFTTGGAYTELNKKFDKTSAGDQVTYSLSGNTLTITSK